MYYETGVIVTPGMAREFLSRNVENNRPPKKDKIQQYARDMASGNWQENTGQTLKFDTRRNLIDGQNRMNAVVMANVAVKFDIAHDVSVEVMPVLDTGATRTAGDALAIAGVRDRNRLSSIVRWSILWDAGFRMGSGPLKPTHTEIVERAASDQGGYDAATARGSDVQKRGLGNASVAGTAFYVFNRLDAVRTGRFFDGLLSGASLEPGAPVLTLRNRLIKAKYDRLTRGEAMALFVRGWNADVRGETPSQLIIVKGELTNDNFPLPVKK